MLLAAAPKAVLLGAVAAVPHEPPVPTVDSHEVAPAAVSSLPAPAAGSPETPDLGSHGAEGGHVQLETQPEAAEPHVEAQPSPEQPVEPQPAVEPPAVEPKVEPPAVEQPAVEPKVEAQPAESEPATEQPAVEPPKVEAVEDANPVAASFTSEPTAAPVTDEMSQAMYVTQKIHDYFSGGIAPSNIKSVMKETVTVLREVEKLSH